MPQNYLKLNAVSTPKEKFGTSDSASAAEMAADAQFSEGVPSGADGNSTQDRASFSWFDGENSVGGDAEAEGQVGLQVGVGGWRSGVGRSDRL